MLDHKSTVSLNKLNTFYFFFHMRDNAKKEHKNKKRSHRRVKAYHDRDNAQRFLLINYLNGK